MRTFLSSICFAAVLGFAAPAHAERTTDAVTLDQLLPSIRASHPGRLSDAKNWVGPNGHSYYLVKWLTPGGKILDIVIEFYAGHIIEIAAE